MSDDDKVLTASVIIIALFLAMFAYAIGWDRGFTACHDIHAQWDNKYESISPRK